MTDLLNVKLDKDMLRIQSRINVINNIFKHGTVAIILKTVISFFVTLQISNGIESINIQEIMAILMIKIQDLNKKFTESCILLGSIDITQKETESQITEEKEKFRIEIYKLFNLSDIFKLLIDKCVTFGHNINRLMYGKFFKTFDEFLHQKTVVLIDTILFTDTDFEFEKSIIELINERVESITNPAEKKLEKIAIAQNILESVANEHIDNVNIQNKIFSKSAKVSIEMHEI
jgi:hypothetical protein